MMDNMVGFLTRKICAGVLQDMPSSGEILFDGAVWEVKIRKIPLRVHWWQLWRPKTKRGEK